MRWLYLLLAFFLLAALGFLAVGDPTLFAIAALGAIFLCIALWKQLEYLAMLGFILLVLAAGLHAGRETHPLLSLSSICASLVAWDLTHYGLLLRLSGAQLDRRMFKRRLLRLGLVLVVGWGLGGLALQLKLQLGFGLLLLLALFVVLSLSLSMMYLRRRDGLS